MRQLTFFPLEPFGCRLSKLPMRQLTEAVCKRVRDDFSKLPMRQLTNNHLYGNDHLYF